MFAKSVLVLVFFGAATGRLANSFEDGKNLLYEAPLKENQSRIGTYLSGLKFVQKVYQDCSKDDVSSCLKIKLIGMMDQFSQASQEVPLIDGVAFVKDPNALREDPPSPSKIEASLPRSLNEKEETLHDMILDRLLGFFQSHKLQIKLPSMTDTDEGAEEARQRRRRNNGMLIIPLILAGTIVPIALGGLALFAGKALLVSKLALVLAIIIGLKKLLGGSGHEKPHEVYISGESGHSRSYKKDPHTMAYRAYVAK